MAEIPAIDGKIVDVLGLGVTTVDDLVYVDSYPRADTKVVILREERQCGGLTATALVAAARLGARCAYAGVLGFDEHSTYVRARLADEGIDLTPLVLDKRARPVHAMIVVDVKGGTRTVLHDDDGVTGGAPEAGPDPALVRASRVLLVDPYGVQGMIRAAGVAREIGIPVVGDFESLRDPAQAVLIELTDHLIVSRDFALRLTGTSSPREAAIALCSPGRAVVVVTCGAEGSWHVAAPAPDHAVHIPTYAVDVADTTGCGDVFHGAYAAALARGRPLVERIRFASAAAALKATRHGGQAGIPSLSAVEAFIAALPKQP